jgi:hypothetical protein
MLRPCLLEWTQINPVRWILMASSHFGSEVYKDYIFKEPMVPSNKSVSVDALRSDTLELRLYQVCTCLILGRKHLRD